MESSKFWFEQEKATLQRLGFTPRPGSGNGLKKEDGDNDYILVQLKQTKQTSISLKLIDWEKLVYHAKLERKIPLFILEFLGGETLLCIRPQDIRNIVKYLEGESYEIPEPIFKHEEGENENRRSRRRISGNRKSFDEVRAIARNEPDNDRNSGK